MCEEDHELSGTKNLERVVVAYSKVISSHSAGKTKQSNETSQSNIETGICFIWNSEGFESVKSVLSIWWPCNDVSLWEWNQQVYMKIYEFIVW